MVPRADHVQRMDIEIEFVSLRFDVDGERRKPGSRSGPGTEEIGSMRCDGDEIRVENWQNRSCADRIMQYY